MQPSYNTYSSGRRGGALLTIILVVALIGSLIFGIWAYSGMANYKNNVDKKIAAASAIVKQQTATEKDKEFAEAEKNPVKSYNGSELYGGVSFQYPKTYSAVITEAAASDPIIDGYFHPNVIPGLQSTTALALRVKLNNKPYDQILGGYTGGNYKVTPFRAQKVPSVLGARIDGELTPGQTDSKVLIPIRDKTIEIWTESQQFVGDFNNVVLPSLSFSP